LGPEATVTLLPAEPVESPVAAIITVNDVAVNEEKPNVEVLVAVNGRQVAHWILGPLATPVSTGCSCRPAPGAL